MRMVMGYRNRIRGSFAALEDDGEEQATARTFVLSLELELKEL
jgi:hypothetical protein